MCAGMALTTRRSVSSGVVTEPSRGDATTSYRLGQAEEGQDDLLDHPPVIRGKLWGRYGMSWVL